MFKVLLQHTWLLITLRHQGQNLKSPFGLSLLILAVSSFFSIVRWYFMNETPLYSGVIVHILIFFFFFKILGSEKTNAVFLISAGVSAISCLLGGVTETPYSILTTVWELIAIFRVIYYIDQNKINNK